MLRDVASRVALDHEVEISMVLIGRDWGVGSHDVLFLPVDGSRERYVLADGKSEYIILVREREPVAEEDVSARMPTIFREVEAHMAVLWEVTVFSLRGNFWKTSGLSTVLGDFASSFSEPCVSSLMCLEN